MHLKQNSLYLLNVLIGSVALQACDNKHEQPTHQPVKDSAQTSSASSSIATDQWTGKWTGPEGTFLKISGQDGNYDLVIQNLDGPANFKGNSTGSEIQFLRNGKPESIQATNGEGTGMKWLMGKSHCLKIGKSEGYCKD